MESLNIISEENINLCNLRRLSHAVFYRTGIFTNSEPVVFIIVRKLYSITCLILVFHSANSPMQDESKNLSRICWFRSCQRYKTY